jgi:hypothetical protein
MHYTFTQRIAIGLGIVAAAFAVLLALPGTAL